VEQVDKIIKYWIMVVVCLSFAYCFFYNNYTKYKVIESFGFDVMFWLVGIVIFLPLLTIMFFGSCDNKRKMD
jgi:hypothetical protein